MANKEQFQDALTAQRLKKEAQESINNNRSEYLLDRARGYIAGYEARVTEDLPAAEKALREIILPWWEEVRGLVAEVNNPRILVWEPSEYLYPHHAYESLAKGFADNERNIEPSVWTGNFWIEERNGEPRLIAKRKVKNGGLWSGYIFKKYEVEISDTNSIGAHLIYPQTILELATAIQSGEVWETLAEGLSH